ncbi:glycosyltransferase family 2 protein [Fusobacterium mortiferum]|uniref:glycosyltransferase family 2 protein n=1 Tax=Fusobacterium mortiferum TaxID=850 RepID=UPI00356A191C
MDVSVIIVNYNTLELTKNTIESVFKKTEGLNYEVILVDNASTDGSVEYFENNYKEKIIFIQNRENLGFGKANNKGIEIAKGKYIFLLNSDTLLINNAIKILFDFMEQNIECGVCGGNLYDRDNKPVHSFKKELVNIYSDFDFIKNFILKFIYKKRMDFNYTNKNIEVGYITGADMFIRKKMLEKVGIFDSDFFMYFEETELTARIKSSGKKIISVPQAKIIHLEGKSTQFKERKFRMFTESKYKYFYKVFSLREVKLAYYISQLKYLIPLNDGWMKLKINKEEYQKFLQNYKNLRKDY